MAVTYVYFDDQKPHGRLLRRALNHTEEGVEGLVDIFATMARMLDGDGSDAAHFNEVVTRFGFASNAAAKSAYDELNSLVTGKLDSDASTSNVKSAIAQALAIFRA